MNKTLVIIAGLIGTLALGLWFFWPFGGNGELRLSGVVEIQEVRLGSKIGGRVLDVLVTEGDDVSPEQKLVLLETPEWIAQRDQWKAQLDEARAELDRALNGFRDEDKKGAQAAADAAKARYDRLVEGWRPEEKKQAESELRTAEADYKQTEVEFFRVADLYSSKSIAKSEFDAALGARDRSRGRVDAARAKHEMMQKGSRKEDMAEAKAEWDRTLAKVTEMYNGTRKEDIEIARAKVEQMRAKLAEAEVYLSEAIVRVPARLGKARVEVVAVRPGDMAAANSPIIRVLRTDDMWIKIFVPETKLDSVRLNQQVDVVLDSGRTFKGVVKHKSSISEFTPRNVQSVDERRHQVFAVKVYVDDPAGHFNAGMAAQVVIPVR